MIKNRIDIIYKNVDELIPYVNNPRHNENAVDAVASSIKNFGFKQPIVIDSKNEIVAGHTRLLASKKLGLKEVPVIIADDLTEAQVKAFRLADNKVGELASWDYELLDLELEEIEIEDLDINMSEFGFGLQLEEEKSYMENLLENDTSTPLVDTFIIPPFSILDTRLKAWQERKDKWKSLGIKSELGRDEDMIFNKHLQHSNLQGTSIFDPVLCEISYRWFMPDNGINILDPFAGGSVRGIVAEQMGFKYTGIDLRQEQVDANYKNAEEIGCNIKNINWICDNSLNINSQIEDNSQDLIFTCPPYYDLEVYSDNKEDLSNMDYEEFEETYTNILKATLKTLKKDRFAIVVISDIRDKKGFYRDLCGITKKALDNAGAKLYNELILYNPVGTAHIRARSQMKNRKMVKVHQNVLVFYKGNPKDIKNNFRELELLIDEEEVDSLG